MILELQIIEALPAIFMLLRLSEMTIRLVASKEVSYLPGTGKRVLICLISLLSGQSNRLKMLQLPRWQEYCLFLMTSENG